MSLHDHAKKNQYFLKNTSTQVVLDKHAGALIAIPFNWLFLRNFQRSGATNKKHDQNCPEKKYRCEKFSNPPQF
jgi:hypothetical protein